MIRVLIIIMAVAGLRVSAAEAKLKIGVVNIERAMRDTNEGKRAEAQLTKFKKKLEATLNRELKGFYEKEKKLREAWSVLKDAERRKRAQASQAELKRLQEKYVKSERDLMQRKTKALMRINRKLNKIVAGIAKREGYDYIFSNAALLWAPPHVDLTNQVIRSYNGGK